MRKILKVRTKIEAAVAIGIIISLIIGSVWATRTITSTSDTWTGTMFFNGNIDFVSGSHFNLTQKIVNSKGHVWNATGDNLQLAIYDLANVSGTVYLPAGTITASTAKRLYLTSNLTLQGAGMSSTILKLPDGYSVGYWVYGSGLNNVTIQDMSFDGNMYGEIVDNSAGIFSLINCKYLTINNVHMYNCVTLGLGLTTCKYGKVTNLYVDDIDDLPSTQQAVTGSCSYFEFDNIHIKSNGTYATTQQVWGMDLTMTWTSFNNVYIDGTGGGFKIISPSHNLTFTNIHICNLTNLTNMQGIWVSAGYDLSFNNIHIEAKAHGFDISSGGQRVNINNMVIFGGLEVGMYLTGDFITINNAQFYHNDTEFALYMSGCDDSKFSNIMIKNWYEGIEMTNCDRDTFTGVTVDGCAVSGVYATTSTFLNFLNCQILNNANDGLDFADATACHNFTISNCIFSNNGAKSMDIRSDCNYFIINGCICSEPADEIDINAVRSSTRRVNDTICTLVES